MSESRTDKAVIVLRDLARFYDEKSQEFEQNFKIEDLNFDKVRELEARCNILTDQFRILQQRLIGKLDENDLDNFIKISKIFDELRILYSVAVDFLKVKVPVEE